jgi:phage/plasmid-like protein (TIGR03299 family)
MAHELELNEKGEAQMFYRGETPWHKLGTFIEPEKELTSEEAIVASGLNWDVKTQPLFLADGTQAPSNAVVRQDNNNILGVVGQSYTPLQNNKAFEFFDPFIKSGEAMYETAGSLKEGKRIWVLAKMNKDPMVIKGNDIVEKYILLSNSHDGTMAVRAGFTPIRVVCNNTLSMAHSKGTSDLIRIRHGQNVETNVEKVREIMNLANQQFEATAEQYRFLASKQVNSEDLAKFVKLVFTGPKYEELEKLGLNPNKQIIQNIIPLFEKGRGNDMVGVKGTAWGAYNAVNEYLQYERGNDADSRLDKMWFGDSAILNQKALNIITKLVA